MVWVCESAKQSGDKNNSLMSDKFLSYFSLCFHYKLDIDML